MMGSKNHKRVLALDVRPLRFGFVIFEGPDKVLDWGVKSFPSGAKAVKVPPAKKIAALLDEFAPQAVVLKERVAHRSKNYVRMADSIGRQAENHQVPLKFVTRPMVKSTFAGHERNKHEIACVLAARFPELASKLPPKRKCWQSEDYRMSLFDAAALGVAYFIRYAKRVPNPSAENPAP